LTLVKRRAFVATTSSCAAHLALAALLPPAVTRRWIRPFGRVVAREPFGTLEQVADGIWALISTPLNGDRTTLSNGGLIAGTDGVLAIEGFFTREGAAWLAERSVELTGRRPTHVALTHYHADHITGLSGYSVDDRRPAVRATADTRDRASLSDIALLDPHTDTMLDLGGRRVTLSPRAGHTASDVTLTVEDPRVVFCGDLVWNGMFPNYVDTMPSLLGRTVRALRAPETTFVPGHGSLATLADVDRYLAMLEAVEVAARRAHEAGTEAAVAAAAFVVPEAVGEWILFGRTFIPRAFSAWYRDLSVS
jgi:glyoxylase-like metal-dependent hydrolase (beta-lactamase superfamily II)